MAKDWLLAGAIDELRNVLDSVSNPEVAQKIEEAMRLLEEALEVIAK